MDICGFVLLHCMFCMLRDQNLASLNCGVSFETLSFLENSHFIEYKVLNLICHSYHAPTRLQRWHTCLDILRLQLQNTLNGPYYDQHLVQSEAVLVFPL